MSISVIEGLLIPISLSLTLLFEHMLYLILFLSFRQEEETKEGKKCGQRLVCAQ